MAHEETRLAYDTDAFRARYRAQIHPRYNRWLHGGWVLACAAAWLVYYARQLQAVQAWEWLAVPLGLVFSNWGEYSVHRWAGHHKRRLTALFYQRHTGDHHSFFVEHRMPYEQARDWRVILFPGWLIVLYSVLLVAPQWWLLSHWNGNVAALWAGTLISGYLMYEAFHACEHLAPTHPLSRLPWVRQMRRLHELHHRRTLMQVRNFNIVFPLMDWLYGTLHWEPESNEPPSSP